MLCYLWYLLILKNIPSSGGSDSYAKLLLANDVIRTIACGGWVYVTSSDDHGIHDFAMIIYLLCTVPHVIGTIKSAPQDPRAQKLRPYTYYALFEWSLIFSDLAFDAVCMIDFEAFEIRVIDVGMGGSGNYDVGSSSFNELRTFGGFVFWSMLTSLPLMIWYFPLWHMGLSGYEAFLFCNVTVGLLGFASLRHTIDNSRGWFHLASLIGIYSYKILDPAYRLMAVAAGVSLSLLTWGATLFSQRAQNGRAERGVLTLALGLILHNVIKQAWWANNPIWPIMDEKTGGANMLGLVMGVLASVQVIRRQEPHEYESKPNEIPSGSGIPKTQQGESWIFSAVSAGGYLFCLHSMFTEAATISRWSLGGYPNTGPGAIAGGLMVIVAMAGGLALSSNRQLVTSWIWFGVGTTGLLILHRVEGDVGFFG
ncbi:hypothetical protein BGZ97_008470, partial [Linnemannia gamsii]